MQRVIYSMVVFYLIQAYVSLLVFWVLLMSVYNLAKQPGPIIGGYLYGWGVPPSTLVIISAVFTMLCWFLIPLLRLQD